MFYFISDTPKSMPFCCGVLEIGGFKTGVGKLPLDKYCLHLTGTGNSPEAAAKDLVSKFIDSYTGFVLMMSFYRPNHNKGYNDAPNEVESTDLAEEFECKELMDAFEAAGAKEIARFINPNSLNEVRTLVYTDRLVSLETN